MDRTLALGGELTAGGSVPDDPELEGGFFYQPTVVADPPAGCPMETEEVFGPALPIWRVSGLDEAIERANASQFGLGSSVWTSDLRTARIAALWRDASAPLGTFLDGFCADAVRTELRGEAWYVGAGNLPAHASAEEVAAAIRRRTRSRAICPRSGLLPTTKRCCRSCRIRARRSDSSFAVHR